MHFLDAWREISGFDLARLVAPVAFMGLAAFLPGRRMARIGALGVTASVPFLRELGVSREIAVGWVLLWAAIAWRAGIDDRAERPRAARAVLETGFIGLLLAVALIVLLIAAVARQDMSPEDARRASFGVVFMGLGLFHLMLRRHARRAALAFAALGLGLQVLDGAARGAQVAWTPAPGGIVLGATMLAVALVLRISSGRVRHAGTAWVSDAHDLHD